MTFEECVHMCFAHKGLVAEYDRLSGTNLCCRGSLNTAVDFATGRMESDIPDFVSFVERYIWNPVVSGATKQ